MFGICLILPRASSFIQSSAFDMGTFFEKIISVLYELHMPVALTVLM